MNGLNRVVVLLVVAYTVHLRLGSGRAQQTRFAQLPLVAWVRYTLKEECTGSSILMGRMVIHFWTNIEAGILITNIQEAQH